MIKLYVQKHSVKADTVLCLLFLYSSMLIVGVKIKTEIFLIKICQRQIPFEKRSIVIILLYIEKICVATSISYIQIFLTEPYIYVHIYYNLLDIYIILV